MLLKTLHSRIAISYQTKNIFLKSIGCTFKFMYISVVFRELLSLHGYIKCTCSQGADKQESVSLFVQRNVAQKTNSLAGISWSKQAALQKLMKI